MSRRGISVQLYTVRDALERDLPGTLGRLAALGFSQVEPFDVVRRADAVAAGLAEHGLTAPSGHVMLIGEDLDAVFAAARTVGMTTVIHPMVEAAAWAERDSVEAIARGLNDVAARAADRGLVVGYHNHAWELESAIGGRPALEVFADLLDDRVVLEVDTYWVQTGGVSPVELLKRLGERVTHLHVKDGPATMDTKAQVALGSGVLDVPGILAAAPDAMRVLELDDCSTDVFDALRDGLAYLAAIEGGAR